MAKILVTEPIVEEGLDILRAAGHEVDLAFGLDEKSLAKKIAQADALIVRSGTQVTEELLEAGTNLSAVGRAGVGVNNIDVEKATELGIVVVNAPEANILSAAEHTMGLILAQARNIPQAHNDLKVGNWNRPEFSGVELSEKTLGIVGLGRIGQLVTHRAQAFGMKVVAHDPYVSTERASQMNVRLMELKQLVAESDFVSLHTVATPETKHLINAEVLAVAKPGLRLINVSRGEAVDEQALYDAIKNGVVAGAALDVFSTEPPEHKELLALDQVVATPHLGASTAEAQDRVGITVAEQIVTALAGGFPPFAVNISAHVIPELLRPFLPLCEMLGRFFAAMDGDLATKKLEVSFQGDIGALDVEAGTLAVMVGLLKAATEQPLSYVNAQAVAKSHGLNIETHRNTTAQEYVNQVTISSGSGRNGDSSRVVAGTVTELERAPRIIRIDNHKFNLAPARHMVLVENDDRPGVIGLVGTILGEAGVNIDDMHVGRSQEGAALMVIATTESATEDVRQKLESADGINAVQLIELG